MDLNNVVKVLRSQERVKKKRNKLARGSVAIHLSWVCVYNTYQWGGGLYKKRFKVSKDHGQLTPKVQAQHLCFSFQKFIFI